VELTPGKRVEIEQDFHVLSHVHTRSAPPGRLGIHSPMQGGPHLVEARDWEDIWIDGQDICVLGWVTRDEFRRRARLIPEGSSVFQFSRTRTRNLAMDVSDLRPLAALLELSRKQRR
jgi:hypothetical protein